MKHDRMETVNNVFMIRLHLQVGIHSDVGQTPAVSISVLISEASAVSICLLSSFSEGQISRCTFSCYCIKFLIPFRHSLSTSHLSKREEIRREKAVSVLQLHLVLTHFISVIIKASHEPNRLLTLSVTSFV